MYLHLDEKEIDTLKETIKGKPGLENILEKLEKEQEEEDQIYIKGARRLHEEEGSIEIDDNAIVSKGDGGAYVMAWVWVYD